MCIKVVDSSQEVGYLIHSADTSWSDLKPFLSTSQKHAHYLPLLVSPARTSRQRQSRRLRLFFSCSVNVCTRHWQWQQASSSRQAAASKQQASKQQQASSSRQAATKPSSKQAASNQQQARSSRQSSSRQAATTSVWVFERNVQLVPGALSQNNEITQSRKDAVMPKLAFFQAHGVPIRLLRADTT